MYNIYIFFFANEGQLTSILFSLRHVNVNCVVKSIKYIINHK